MEIQRVPQGYTEMMDKLRARFEDAEKKADEKAKKSGSTSAQEAATKALKLQQSREGVDRIPLKNREVLREPSGQIKAVAEGLHKQAEEEAKITKSLKGRVTPGAPEEKR